MFANPADPVPAPAQKAPGEGTRAEALANIVLKPFKTEAEIIYNDIEATRDSYTLVRERVINCWSPEVWVTRLSGMTGGNKDNGSTHVTQDGWQARIRLVADPEDDSVRVWSVFLGEGDDLPAGCTLDLALPRLWDSAKESYDFI